MTDPAHLAAVKAFSADLSALLDRCAQMVDAQGLEIKNEGAAPLVECLGLLMDADVHACNAVAPPVWEPITPQPLR